MIMIALAFAIIVFISLLCFLTLAYIRQRALKDFPGPEPNLFFGNIYMIMFKPLYDYMDIMMELHDMYGPILRIHDGPLSTAVFIKDVKLIEHILSSTKLINKARQYQWLHKWLSTGLLTSTGTKWRQRRKMITPAFHFSILENFVHVFETNGNVFIDLLKKEVDKPSIDITPFVALCTLDIICEAAMGIKLNSQVTKTSKYVRSVKEVCKIFGMRQYSIIHPTLYPLTLNYFVEKRAIKILHAHTDNIIEQRITERNKCVKDKIGVDEFNQKKRLAFLDLLLESTIDEKALTRLDIREEVDTFMFEGHDTTSSAISFALHSLANNPEVQQKAYEEQKSLFADLKTAKPTVAQLNDMKYLELVIKETLRLYPSVPYIARELSEDVEYDGKVLPKGLNVVLFTFAVHRDPVYFPDPLKFDPERFEDTRGTNPYIYTPFSAGPRNCIGQKFAMLEMKSTISKVIRNFELYPSTTQEKLQLSPETILVSKNGVCISLKNRL
ncbi:cytochrome P450 4d2-like isoform X1 [Diabrotica undecimpunctata]|uniref:cytochrome P450 4d2-like isoform X1 n=1 Tax=Diabrotica undecimpunctata TaxID=50387 RepID=UPI003B63EC9C